RPQPPQTADETPLVHLTVDRAIATITLDSPTNRNALSARVRTGLSSALTEAMADDKVRDRTDRDRAGLLLRNGPEGGRGRTTGGDDRTRSRTSRHLRTDHGWKFGSG